MGLAFTTHHHAARDDRGVDVELQGLEPLIGHLTQAAGLDGALDEQPIREAGNWGQIVPGSEQTKLAALFPRIEVDSADAAPDARGGAGK